MGKSKARKDANQKPDRVYLVVDKPWGMGVGDADVDPAGALNNIRAWFMVMLKPANATITEYDITVYYRARVSDRRIGGNLRLIGCA